MKRKLLLFLACSVLLLGCATPAKKSLQFTSDVKRIKTIAVLPADIKVYQLTAGNVRELIDEWSQTAKSLVNDALKEFLAKRYGFEVKFISEDWLKKNNRSLWENNRALYDAVSLSAMLHAYPGVHAFKDKLKNFDYTLGPDINELSQALGADGLLFVCGYDHEATAGRQALLFWDVLLSAVTGVVTIPTDPSLMTMGLVDGTSGQLEWFKISPAGSEYSFRSKKNINTLVEWITRDFLKEK